MGRACNTHGKEEEYMPDFGGKARRKKVTRNTRSRWEDKIKIVLREIDWASMEGINIV
jgi:hypothetical protein